MISNPPDPSAIFYYAHRRERNGKVSYYNASPNLRWLNLFQSPDPIVRLRIREWRVGDEEPSYWGWLKTGDPGKYTLVWPTEIQFNICFQYGYKPEEDRGKGRRVKLVVEEVPEP
jgi:hypothetical protein